LKEGLIGWGEFARGEEDTDCPPVGLEEAKGRLYRPVVRAEVEGFHVLRAFWTIVSARARAAVAAGEGALSTWRLRGPTSKWKSSQKVPSGVRARARTPERAGMRSRISSAGTSRRKDA
jgi:hypothetical protein